MTKQHLCEDGKLKRCTAKSEETCTKKGPDGKHAPHFNSIKEAEEFFEKENAVNEVKKKVAAELKKEIKESTVEKAKKAASKKSTESSDSDKTYLGDAAGEPIYTGVPLTPEQVEDLNRQVDLTRENKEYAVHNSGRLYMQEGNHNKFWEAEYNENTGILTTRYGRIGQAERESSKEATFDEYQKLINSKLRKGYE